MNISSIKTGIISGITQIKEVSGWIKPNLTVLFAGLFLLFFITTSQMYCDRRDISRQNKQLQRYDEQTAAALQRTNELMGMFQQQHQQTVDILDQMKIVNDRVTNLMDRDAKFDAQVESIKQTYENVKNPNKTITAPIGRYRPLKRGISNDRAETDLLENDKILYGQTTK